MAKLQDYELRRLGQQCVDFFDDMQGIVNYGKYAFPIVSAVPAWTADNGEMAFYDGVAVGTLAAKRIYVRLSSSWEVFATSPFPAVGVPADGEGAIQFNSSNTFGGVPYFLYTLATSSFVIYDPIAVYTSLTVGTNGHVSISQGQFGNGGGGILSFGVVGAIPSGATDSVQLLAGNNVGQAGLVIVPESAGPHFIGDRVGLNHTTPIAVLDIHDAAGTIYYSQQFDGKSIFFGNNSDTDVVNISSVSSYGSNVPFGGYVLEFNIDTNVQPASGGFFFFNKENRSNVIAEEPALVCGGVVVGAMTGHVMTLSNGVILATQRQNVFFAPTINSGATVGTTVSAVTDSATVYIDAAPRGDASRNRYALWIDQGAVRIDGQLITGAETTSIKANGVFFTTTAIGVSSNNAADTTLIRGVVGTTSLVANTLSDGRVIRLQAWGYYNTQTVPDTLQMRVKIGGTTVLTTGAQTPAGLVSTGAWALNANIVCQTTGGAGTVFAQGDFPHFNALTYANWPMVTSSTTIINTTGANVVEITAQWGGTNSANQIFVTQAIGELLN